MPSSDDEAEFEAELGLESMMAVAFVGLHEMYLQLQSAGFTAAEALQLVGNVLANGTRGD